MTEHFPVVAHIYELYLFGFLMTELHIKYQMFKKWNKWNELKRNWERLYMKKISDNLECPKIVTADELNVEVQDIETCPTHPNQSTLDIYH